MEKKETKETKKEKKAKKFNSERIARLAKNALKAVFPDTAFVVSSFVDRVEVLYPSNDKLTPAQKETFNTELGTFKAVFSAMVKIKHEELVFCPYERKAA
jgi:hypothetical protein